MKRQILHSVLFAIVAIILFALPQHAQAQTKEAYVVKSDDGKTLTFYYDTQKATRPGDKWGINETQTYNGITLPAWSGTYSNPNTAITQAVIDPSFKDFRPKTTALWFNRLQALTQITGIEHLNTSEVTDMNSMFYDCEALTQLDVTKFDTRNVTKMSYMFYGCSALTRLDVSKFNTQNVTNMRSMFYGCAALSQLDVSKFDTQNVTNMSSMFEGCAALPQLDVSKFDTKNVTDMDRMFSGCAALTRLDVSNFNTANVTDMACMFAECAALTQLDVSKFDTHNVTRMNWMFGECSALPQLDVSNFNTANVTNIGYMFSNCAVLTTIYCNKAWTCGNSAYMFIYCKKLKGAVSYDENKIDATMANPDTGYFTKKGPAGIVQTGHATTVKAVYSADGRRLKAPQPGVNIMKMSDGTTRKVVKK